MIECRKCNFAVQQSMRHAITNNCCPACGSALLGEVHKRRLDIFKNKVTNQPFSSKLDSDDIFDIALFMLVEFFPPSLDDKKQEASEPDEESGEEKVARVSAEVAEREKEEEGSESYEDIREQVRKEMVSSSADLTAEEMDEDLRIQRLKRMAKENRINKPGATVRRVDS